MPFEEVLPASHKLRSDDPEYISISKGAGRANGWIAVLSQALCQKHGIVGPDSIPVRIMMDLNARPALLRIIVNHKDGLFLARKAPRNGLARIIPLGRLGVLSGVANVKRVTVKFTHVSKSFGADTFDLVLPDQVQKFLEGRPVAQEAPAEAISQKEEKPVVEARQEAVTAPPPANDAAPLEPSKALAVIEKKADSFSSQPPPPRPKGADLSVLNEKFRAANVKPRLREEPTAVVRQPAPSTPIVRSPPNPFPKGSSEYEMAEEANRIAREEANSGKDRVKPKSFADKYGQDFYSPPARKA